MRGPFPAHSRPRRASTPWRRGRTLALVAVLTTVPLLSGCKEIDNAQWSNDPFRTGEAAARAASLASDTDSSSGSTATVRTSGGGTVVVRQTNSSDTSGVDSGGNAGARRSDTASVVVFTAPSTCWSLVVDGNQHSGCGNASITDTQGERAGRVTKLSGSEPIQLQLLVNSQAVASGQVSGNNRYVTVRG